MEEIDVAIFAFDGGATLRLVNRAGQELLAAPAERILGRSAAEIGIQEFLEGDSTRVLATSKFPGGSGRWGMRRTSFREGGLPHTLVVIADLSVPLREEELRPGSASCACWAMSSTIPWPRSNRSPAA